MNEAEMTSAFEYHADKFKQELIKEFSKNEKQLTVSLSAQVDEYCKSRLSEIIAHNLNECRQLSTNTLTSLF